MCAREKAQANDCEMTQNIYFIMHRKLYIIVWKNYIYMCVKKILNTGQ